MSGKKIIEALNEAIAFANGDTSMGRIVRPHWLRVGAPCHLPTGAGLVVDFDDTMITVATRDGIEATFPIAWCGWQQ